MAHAGAGNSQHGEKFDLPFEEEGKV